MKQHMEALQLVVSSESQYLRRLIDDLRSNTNSPRDRGAFFDTLSKLGVEMLKCFKHEENVLASQGVDLLELEACKREHDRIVEQYTDLNLRLMRGAPLELEDLAFLYLKPLRITVSK